MAKRTVIINLQKTPYDDDAHLRIFAYSDPVLLGLMARLQVSIDPVPAQARRRPSLPSIQKGNAAQKKPPTPPASAKSMRAHMRATAQAATRGGAKAQDPEVAVTVQPAAVGVTVRGREVVKVTKGSQAEALGVQAGWRLSHVAGNEMPEGGQAAADAITRALARGKQGGKPYVLNFITAAKPRSPVQAVPARQVNATSLVAVTAAAAAVAESRKKIPSGAAFAGFSSGLAVSSHDHAMAAELIHAHRAMLNMAQGLAAIESACA